MLSLFVCMHALLIITGYWCMFYTMISFFYVFQFGVMLDVYKFCFFALIVSFILLRSYILTANELFDFF